MAADAVQDFSNALGNLAARVGPSVVRVEGRQRPASGVALTTELVVAAAHTLEEDELQVGLPDGRSVPAQLVGRDAATDLAVLKVEGAQLAPAPWLAEGSGLAARVGSIVLAISRPGKTARAALGVVSALSEAEWRTPGGGKLDRYLESDLQPRPGFSGSALCDAAGNVIGLNTTGLVRGAAAAIPAATVARVVKSLVEHGAIPRGYLGVSTLPAQLPEALAKELGQPGALLVSAVDPASPAFQAGLLLGDAIAGIDGSAVGHPGELLELLDDKSVGRTVQLRVVRAGQVRELPLTIGKRGEKP